MVAISYRALVFHPQVWRFDQFIAILIKWVGPEPVFKCLEHRLYARVELRFRFIQIRWQYPVIEVEFALFAVVSIGKFRIISDVSSYVIVVDRVGYEPVETGITVTQIGHFTQAAVGYILQTRRHTDADEHAV